MKRRGRDKIEVRENQQELKEFNWKDSQCEKSGTILENLFTILFLLGVFHFPCSVAPRTSPHRSRSIEIVLL